MALNQSGSKRPTRIPRKTTGSTRRFDKNSEDRRIGQDRRIADLPVEIERRSGEDRREEWVQFFVTDDEDAILANCGREKYDRRGRPKAGG